MSMPPARRRRVGFAAVLLALLLPVGGPRLVGQSASEPPVRVLFPLDGTVLESGRFELLAVAASAAEAPPELRVDGAAAPWEPYAPPALLASLELAPGPHEVSVGPQTLRVLVRGEGASPADPPGWEICRTHADSTAGRLGCAVCHEAGEEGGRVAIREPQEPAACLACHSRDEFALVHFHPLEPVAHCHLCHALHGSTRPSLLRAPVKELCAACHD